MTQAWPIASQLLNFPFELHGHIAIFLPPSSIASLIGTNSHLRSVYEQTLYRHVFLYIKPHRSVGLLRTFTLRPDLALLVHSLDIDLRPCEVKISSGSTRLQSSHSARLDPLALARNIKSFGLSGVAWLCGEEMEPIQNLISKMKLTSFRVYEWWPNDPSPQIEHCQMVFANLRKVLQGQPLLQDLRLEYFLLKRDSGYVGSTPIGIESSDLPNLRTLRADAATVAAILPTVATGQLSTLEMDSWGNSNHSLLVSSFTCLTEARQRVRKLHLSIEWNSSRGWGFDFGRILELFPNVESLRVLGSSTPLLGNQPTLLHTFFEKVASQITQSPNLTTLEMSLTFNLELEPTDINDVDEELMLSLKSSCPSLKTFIDQAQWEWAFLPSDKEGQSISSRVVKVGQLYWSSPRFRWDICAVELDL